MRQGKVQIPTVHMGVDASRMERRGIRTERGDQNRQLEITNSQIRQLRARIIKLEKWIAEEAANSTPPTLADILDEIMSRQGQSSLTRLRNGVEIFNYLYRNDIHDMKDLEKKVNAMNVKLNSAREDLNKTERRIDTLEEHIQQSENFKEHRRLKRAYDGLYSEYTAAKKATGFFAERKAQKALDAVNSFCETNYTGLTLYNTAEKYLHDVLQKRFDPKKLPPITMWREELAAKTADKDALYQEYYALKDETAKVENIRKSVEKIIQGEQRLQIKAKKQDLAIVSNRAKCLSLYLICSYL